MDSDNAAIDEGRKQSPEEVSGPESGQCEAEADGEDNMKNEASKDGPSAQNLCRKILQYPVADVSTEIAHLQSYCDPPD